MANFYVGGFGHTIRITFVEPDGITPKDISAADVLEMEFQDENDNSNVKVNADGVDFVNTGSDGAIDYTTEADVWTAVGFWRVRGVAQDTGVYRTHTEWQRVEVS